MIFDVPRITSTIRDSISEVVNSSVIYNTTENRYEYYDGSIWKPFGSGSGGGVVSFNTRTGAVTLLDSDIASLGDFTVSGTITVNNDIILGSQALKIISTSVDPSVSGVVANQGSIILKTDGSLWQKLGSGDTEWSQIQTGEYTNEPTGFPIGSDGEIDRTSSTISFTNNNRTFSISPSGSAYTILIKGRQYRKTSTESIQISTTIGSHYIYFNENGELHETTSFSLDFILKYVAVSIVYWDGSSAIIFADERHGCTMDSHTHARLHAAGGAVYISGMSPGDFTANGNGNSESHLTFSVSSGYLRDEDILHSLSSKSTSNPIPIFYREGTTWKSSTPSAVDGTYARAIGTDSTPGIIAYNQLSGVSWSRTTLTANNFVCYHLIGTNDINNPYIMIMGTTEYNTKPEAKAGAITEIGTLTDLPFNEMVLIATVLFSHSVGNTNSLQSALVSTNASIYEDWRFIKTLNPTTAPINNHNNLGGIYGGSPFYHSDQPITTTDSVTFHAINSSTTLNVTGTSTLNTTNITDANVSGALNVTGTSTLTTTNMTTGNLTTGNVSGALNVTGTSTQTTVNLTTGNVSGALNVTGTSTQTTVNLTTGNVSGALNVSGTSTLATTNMTNSNVSGTLNVTGTSTQSTVNMTTGNIGTANVTGGLSVTGTSTLNTVNLTTGNVSGALNVTGTSTLATTNMTASNVSGVLNVTGTSILTTANMTTGNISGTLNVTGTSTQASVNMTAGNISGNLNVTGTSHLTTVELDSLTASTINNTGNITIGSNSGNTVTINSNAISIPNGLNFDSNTLIIDSTNNRIGVNKTPLSALDVSGATSISGDLTVGGNLTINGTTTTVNSTITTLEDPIIVLGKSSPVTDDNKDRGISFNYHTGSSPKVGYFGYQDSTGKLIYIPDATIIGEVVSGSKGTIDAYIDFSNINNTPDYLLKTGGTITGNLSITGTLNTTGTSTLSTVNLTTGNVSGALNVTGTSTLATTNMSAANVTGNLNVTGTTNLGNVYLNQATIYNDLAINGNTTIGNEISDSLTIIGNIVSIPNSLNIASNTLIIDSGNSRIGIKKSPSVELDVSGSAAISGALNVTGTSTQSTVNLTTGNVTGALNVTGTSTQTTVNLTTGNVSGALNVTGTTTLGTVNFTTGNSSGAFNVTGTSTLKNVTASGTVIINGLTYPSTGGTNGQAIITDGSGNLSFGTVSSSGGGNSVSFTSSTDFPLGSPIYLNSSGTWQLAIANLDTSTVQFVVSTKTGSGTISYTALSSGELTLTTAQWDAITGGSGGLTTGSPYFLSSTTAGKISKTVGLIYAPVLRAISSTKAFVSLSINSIESGAGDTFYRETTTTVATTSSITLTYPPAGKAYTWLSIDGVIQSGNDFSIAGNTLTLGASVPSGTLIDILYARSVLLADSNAINKMVAFSETVTGSGKTTFNLPSSPSGLSSCIVFVGGAIQDTTKFNISGNVLTMTDSVPVGVQLVAYVLNSSGTSNSIDSFVTRQTYSLPTSGTVNISTIFGSQVSGLYRFFDINDPRISGTVLVKHNGTGVDPDVRVDSNSSSVSITINTASKLNVYIASNLVTFQNNTSNTTSLRIYREI